MGSIYLVRHGQAPASAYGVPDELPAEAGLTELGVRQARATGAMLAAHGIEFTSAICGDLPRQRDTLRYVLEAAASPPEPQIDPAWNEYELPARAAEAGAAMYRDGAGYQDLLESALSHWVSAGDAADEGMESHIAFTRRVREATARAAEQAGSGKTVLVVSSAGVIGQWLADLWDIPPLTWPRVTRTIFNASVSRLIVGRRGVTLVSLNEHAHLLDDGLTSFR